MKTFEEVVVEVKEELPTSITCNKCGKSTKLQGEDYEREWQANSYQSLYCHFGFGSKFDTETWEFELCEKCLIEFIRTFNHLPEGYDEEYANRIFK